MGFARSSRRTIAGWCALLATGLAGHAVAAGGVTPDGDSSGQRSTTQAYPAKRAEFGSVAHSANVSKVVNWAVASGDHGKMPFVIIDKVNARAFVFDNQGSLLGAAPVLLGVGRGDESAADIGTRRLSAIPVAERVTPAGRFVASLGHNLGQKDILWVDYAAAISFHRVIVGNPGERRLERLTTASTRDNRISYGCINVPVAFYEKIIRPTFKSTSGIVYVLPERKSLYEVLGIRS